MMEHSAILYVEDDETLAALVKRKIAKKGYDVEVASDCASAIKCIQQHDYALLIIDYQLPDTTGIEFLKQLKQLDVTIPSIMVSGQDDIRVAVDALNLGCMDYLIKDGLGYLELLPVHIKSVFDNQLLKQLKLSAEKETLKARESLARAQHLAHIGSWEWNRGDATAWWSDEHFAIFGLERDERKGVSLQDYQSAIHPLDRDRVIARELEVYKGNNIEFEYRIIRTDGSVRWVHAIDFSEFNESGHIVRCYGTIQDVTQSKESEHQLQLAQRVFESTTEAIMVCDADRNIISVNPAFTQITGYDEDEVIGKPLTLLRTDDYNKDFYKSVWQQLGENGSWAGEIYHKNKSGNSYPEWLSITAIYDNEGKIEQYISIFSDITEHKKAEEIIAYQANYDTLTDLPNRNLFNDRLNSAIKFAERDKDKIALLFLDLDRFKWINDTLGHRAGDKLLKETADRLNHIIRDSDTISRLGGDEFTIILNHLNNGVQAEVVAEKILQKLAEPYFIDDNEVYVSGSVGITIYPDDGTNVETLFKNADTAMYEAKEHGRNRYSFFTETMQREADKRLSLLSELQLAIKREQFELYYQPIMHAASGELYAAEALLRWPHETQGFISPDAFIPLAEETGLIHTLGDWVMQTALHQIAKWQAAGHDLQVSINKSGKQFQNKECAKDLYTLFNELQIDASKLTIEITETALIEQNQLLLEVLENYREAGIKISLDDFGTGYSSLNYLRQFPFDVIKIDRSFICDILTNKDNATLVNTIILMGHNLGLSVLAEGVETEEQRQFLVKLGCDYVQGYLYSPAIPADSFERQFLNK